jgi:CBS domain-containing protein
MQTTLQAVIAAKPPRELVSVPASASVARAVAVMVEADIGAVVIQTEDGLPGGIFTERDLLVRVAHAGLDLARTPISMVMTRDVRFVPPPTTVREALDQMLRERLRHLLVIEGPQVHGLLSMRDLTEHLVRHSAAAPR